MTRTPHTHTPRSTQDTQPRSSPRFPVVSRVITTAWRGAPCVRPLSASSTVVAIPQPPDPSHASQTKQPWRRARAGHVGSLHAWWAAPARNRASPRLRASLTRLANAPLAERRAGARRSAPLTRRPAPQSSTSLLLPRPHSQSVCLGRRRAQRALVRVVELLAHLQAR